ncbi:hypothetical protein PENTCL1PPCAC_4893, partial [Pristionchus entomophagus]
MSTDRVVMVIFVIVSHVAMYLTLPLHFRLLYVLIRPSKRIQLDGSFHTLMTHTTIGNLFFALVYCLNQAPAGAGVLFDFYSGIGPVVSHIEMIKIWEYIAYLCYAMWLVTIGISIPLMIPGSTASYTMLSIFDLPSVQYTFLGNYYQLYSIIGSFFATVVEVITIFFYIAMLAKFHAFRKMTQSNAADVRKMTRGVVRTTVAAVVTSMGSWIIVVFFCIVFSRMNTPTPLLDNLQFSSIFVAINNVLTPWVLLIAFPNVRNSILLLK